MNQIETLKALISAKNIKIRNLELENKKLRKQLSKTHAKLKTERQQHKITHAEVKKAKKYNNQLKIQNRRLAAKAESTRKALIKASAHGSFDSWSSERRGYLKSAVSAANRLSRKYPKLYGDLEALVNKGVATKEDILKVIWDVYAITHSGEDADVYDTNPDYVDDETAEVLFFTFQVKYGERMEEGWLEY